MSTGGPAGGSGIRYEPDERPPAPLTLGLGLQLAVLNVAIPILIPTVVMRAAGVTEGYFAWAVFASVAVCGAATVLQAVRFGRFGSGHVLVMASSSAFIGICITAIVEGGPATLATLVVIAALFQLLVSTRLAVFRRVLTPAVSGTVIMLVPVTVMPVVFGMLTDTPGGASALAAPASALATMLVIIAIALKATGAMRLWAPVAGVVAGSVVGWFFGLYDVERVAAASWIGIPKGEWPGFDLDFGPVFWALLPAFLLVALIGAIRAISSSVAIQRVSWRRGRAVDFRAVQGTVTAEGVSNLLCGVAGTVPNTTLSTSSSLAELTGVAARRVGVATGAIFILLAFLPKALAVVLAIPGPVVTAYLVVLMAMLFLVGVSVAMQGGMDYRKGLIVGVSFWVGVGFQNDMVFPEQVAELAGGLFRNGMTTGGLTAILMTLFVEWTRPRRSRIEIEFALSALPKVRYFLGSFATRNGWDFEMLDRLDAVGEEMLLTLLQPDGSGAIREDSGRVRHLHLSARREADGAILEIVAAPRGENLEDRMALLGVETDEAAIEREVSLRLLRHLATSVRHQQYHDTDVLTVHVKAPASG